MRMEIRNYHDTPAVEKSIHGGQGLAHSHKLFGAEDFASGLRYVAFTQLPPGVSIGEHGHKDAREEIYVIQYGEGRVKIDLEERRVKAGDVILTRAGSTHMLLNDSIETMGVFVFWAL
jgi:mannose-6-phosphate isomerase-like protein (cupin superfamily)